MRRKHLVLLAMVSVSVSCLTAPRDLKACTMTVTIGPATIAESNNQDDFGAITIASSGAPDGAFLEIEWSGTGDIALHDEQGGDPPPLLPNQSYSLLGEGVTASTQAAGRTLTVNLKYGDNILASASDSAAVVKTDKVQYLSGETYHDISGTLYIMKATTVTFKAVPAPAGASWPTGKPVWGGTAGASGTGETKQVTFSTKSANTTDFKTVTAECGNTVTVNVIVYELTGYHEAIDAFVGRSLVHYGVGEVSDLSFHVSVDITPAQMGGIAWYLKDGYGGVDNDPGNIGTGQYTASHTVCGVTLALYVTSGPSKDEEVQVDFWVIAPTGGYLKFRTGFKLRHTVNTWSCGWRGDVYLLPKDVSFTNVQFREGACDAVADGWLVQWNGFPHPVGTWIGVDDGDITDGCRVSSIDGDRVYSGMKSPPPAYGVGDFLWEIPWMWRLGAGDGSELTKVAQHATSKANGEAMMEKGTVNKTSLPGDDSTSWWTPDP